MVRIGMLDLFGKVEISPKFSLLSETMIGMMAGGMAMVHQPRLFMDYKPMGALKFRFGRFHAPLGYYAANYPHGGGVFRLTTQRPRLLSMDMGEEMMPLHIGGRKGLRYGRFG